MAETSYRSVGFWLKSLSINEYIVEALGPYPPEGLDIASIERDFRKEIDKVLPDGFSLVGEEFIGPYPVRQDVDIAEYVHGVDFWEIVDRYMEML